MSTFILWCSRRESNSQPTRCRRAALPLSYESIWCLSPESNRVLLLFRQAYRPHIPARRRGVTGETRTRVHAFCRRGPNLLGHRDVVAFSRGLEPPTRSLGNCCSIQLSYENMCGAPRGTRTRILRLRRAALNPVELEERGAQGQSRTVVSTLPKRRTGRCTTRASSRCWCGMSDSNRRLLGGSQVH